MMTTISDPMSLAWVCEHYPQRVQRLFAGLDLDLPELSAVKAAVAAENWGVACEALLDYSRTCPSGQWLRHDPVAPGDATDPKVEKISHGIFTEHGIDIQVPRLPSGGLDWAYVPPHNNDEEWAHGINRHDYMSNVLAAFYATGNRAYVRCLDEHLRDWTTVAEHPGAPGSACPWGNNLDVGHRSKVWPAVFYGLQREACFTPATRVLVLAQALDHARYLRAFHGRGSNWVITEMSGLLSIACSWPEFREAAVWRDYAIQVTREELQKQVYPDGTLKELTSGYQAAVLWHMGFFVDTLRGAGLVVAPELTALLEEMWAYLAYSLAPNGLMPHNSDSDRESGSTDALLRAAEAYHRPEWTCIVTNGEQGQPPHGLPSILFPWAGQLISRSGWDADAHWSFFDIGPWGTLHQHNDALHLSVTACGRDLLVDSGRDDYQHYWGGRGTWRSYFIGSEGHNVILIDGLGQQPGPRTAEAPIGDDQVVITPEYDYARGTFTSGYAGVADPEAAGPRLMAITFGHPHGPFAEGVPHVEGTAIHTRAVLYLRGRCWVVVDRIETDRPRRITPLWHFHPDCTVVREGQSVVTVDEGVGNLRIQPVGSITWEIALVRGREGPDFQGWYSGGLGARQTSTCACYTADIKCATTTAWLLLPGKGPVPEIAVTRYDAPEGVVHLRLDIRDAQSFEIAIRLDDAMPCQLSAGEEMAGRCAVRRLIAQ